MITVEVIRISEGAHTLEMDNGAQVKEVFSVLGIDSSHYTMSIAGRNVSPDTELLDGDTLVLGARKLSAAAKDFIMVAFMTSGVGGSSAPIKVPISPEDEGTVTIKDVYKLKAKEIDAAYFRSISAENFKISMNGMNATFDTPVRSNYDGNVSIVFSKPMSAAQ